ncbi:MAG: chalcone isomerase family protein, partial [Microvirga sp.]
MVFRALALLLLAATAQGAELEGVRLDDRVQVDGQALELNGMAVRTRYYFKVYVAGLYLPTRVTSATRAIDDE